MQPPVGPLLRHNIRLQKILIGYPLDRQEIRYRQNTWTLAEVLAYALFFGEGMHH
jgi:hypothetical protein